MKVHYFVFGRVKDKYETNRSKGSIEGGLLKLQARFEGGLVSLVHSLFGQLHN